MDHSTSVKKDLAVEDKIAVLLASLDSKLSAAIMQQLEPKVMVKVTTALRQLGIVSGTMRDRTLADCLKGIQELGGSVQGDDKMATNLLMQAVGEKKASALMAENQTPTHMAFSELGEMSAEQIAAIISHEQSGVVALVLRFLPSSLSAEILDILPSEVRRQVIVFMCTASDPSEEIIARVEGIVNSKVGGGRKVKKAAAGETDRLSVVTAIIQHAKRSVEEDLLGAIQEKSETLATQIRDRLFTFEDIVRLSDVALRRILQEVNMSVLAIGLRNANMDLREKFFGNMSKRAAEALKEEMDFSQKVRLTDIEAKQREVVNAIRQLEADGQLSTSTTEEYV